MKNPTRQKVFFCVCVSGVFALVFLLNYLTPLVADDYSYAFSRVTGERITSVGQIIASQVDHWFTWGGRSPVHFLVQLFLMFPKVLFDVVNSFVYIAFAYLCCRHAFGRASAARPGFFLLINALLWYSLPVWGQNNLWLTGSVNYLWTATIALVFLLPYRLQLDETRKLPFFSPVAMLVLGVLAGWSNENTGAAILGMLALYFAYRLWTGERLRVWEIAGVVGFLMGFAMLIMSPGNLSRASVIVGGDKSRSSYLVRLAMCSVRYFTPIVIAPVVAFLLVFGRSFGKRSPSRDKVLWMLSGAFFAAFSMIASPTFPARAVMAVCVFSAIAIVMMVDLFASARFSLKPSAEVADPAPAVRVPFWVTGACMLVFAFGSLAPAGIDILGLYRASSARVAGVIAARDRGETSATVESPLRVDDYHTALYQLGDLSPDPAQYINAPFAKYFGLESVRGTPPLK